MAKTKEAKENKEVTILQFAIGRRKRAVARVRMFSGKGETLINGKPVKEYLCSESQLKEFMKPITSVGMTDGHYFTAKVLGGGITGQMGAVQQGIARCIAKVNEDMKTSMKRGGFLTRDPREKERKKVYKIGARTAPQFSKR